MFLKFSENGEEEAKEVPEFEIFGFEMEPITAGLFMMCIFFGILLVFRAAYSETKMKNYVPESILLVILGLIFGAIVGGLPQVESIQIIENFIQFPADIFLFVFIPIIIFDATYFLNKHAFFANFAPIATYAVVGTALSAICTSIFLISFKQFFTLEMSVTFFITFSSLIAAVDPVAVIAIMEAMHVNETVFNIVFGESTLNDGVAIVLYKLFVSLDKLQEDGESIGMIIILGFGKFLVSVIGAVVMGTLVSLVFTLFTRFTHRLSAVEPLLMIICAMTSYILSDACMVSGVIAVMVTAILLNFYTKYNLQLKSCQQFEDLSRLLAGTLETMLFLDVGFQISFIAFRAKTFKIDFIFPCILIIAILFGRFFAIFLQTYFINFRRKKVGTKITWKDQLVFVWSGLRGGVAFALAQNMQQYLDEANGFNLIMGTSICILFTITVQGLTMKPLMQVLKIKTQGHEPSFRVRALSLPIPFIRSFAEIMLGGTHGFVRFVNKLDQVFMKLFLIKPLVMDRELIQLTHELLDDFKEYVADRSMRKLTEESMMRKQGQSGKAVSAISGNVTQSSFNKPSFSKKTAKEQKIIEMQEGLVDEGAF